MKKYIWLLVSLWVAGCGSGHRRADAPTQEKVRIYKVHASHNDGTADWLYYYLIYDQQIRGYYYFTDLEPDRQLANAPWLRSAGRPSELEGRDVQEVEEREVAISELGAAATEIANDFSSIPEANSLNSMEGVPEPADTGSMDSGGGGGDSGGGDGGGDGLQ